MLFRIEIHADTICAFSYLGKRSLDYAMAAYTMSHPDAEFEVTWRSFVLYPKLAKGTPRSIAFQKIASKRQSSPEAIFARLSEMGDRLGAPIDREFLTKGTGLTGPSIDSHRLLVLVRRRCGPAVQIQLADALFKVYFEDGEDISDKGVLARVAVEQAGRLGLDMSVEQVEKWLEGSEYRLDVLGHVREMPAVEAVPSVTVQGKFLVGGYQEPSVFLNLFERMETQ